MNEYIAKLVQNMIWKPKPLTDEEIKNFIATFPIIFTPDDLVIFARAIEHRHGIK